MKNNKRIIFIVIVNIIILGIILSFININSTVLKEKQIIKEMNESTQVSNLQTQINTLNKEHADYANYIQTCKNRIATALTNEKVVTSGNDTLETMSTNIGKVLQARTADATATADNITEGKTAYVNGELIVGNGSDNISYMNKGYEQAHNETRTFFFENKSYKSRGDTMATLSLASYPKFHDLELNKNMFIVITGNQGFDFDYSRTSSYTTPYFSYNKNNGVLTHCAHTTVNANYFFYFDFKILIVE